MPVWAWLVLVGAGAWVVARRRQAQPQVIKAAPLDRAPAGLAAAAPGLVLERVPIGLLEQTAPAWCTGTGEPLPGDRDISAQELDFNVGVSFVPQSGGAEPPAPAPGAAESHQAAVSFVYAPDAQPPGRPAPSDPSTLQAGSRALTSRTLPLLSIR